MALVSLEIASDGMLRTGGLQSLSMSVKGLLNVGGVGPAAVKLFEGLRRNVGRMMR